MNSKISNLILERYLVHELPANEMSELDRRIVEDAGLRDRIRVLRESNAQILDQYSKAEVSKTVANKILAKKSERSRKAIPSFWGIDLGFRRVAFAMAAVLAGLISIPFLFEHTEEKILTKGLSSHLTIYRKLGTGVEKLRNEASVVAGDSIQLSYSSVGEPYGLIFSVDGNNHVTVHYPKDAENFVSLHTEGEVILPESFVLDEAPGFERFFFLTSEQALNIPEVFKEIRQLTQNFSALEVLLTDRKPKGVLQMSILTLNKAK